MNIQMMEELALNAWPSLQTRLYDGWILRFANGYTKRSNSINPLYASTLPLAEKFAHCEQVYQNVNLPAIFKITPASFPNDLDRELEKRNYIRMDETSVRLLNLEAKQFEKPAGIIIEKQFSPTWFAAFAECAELTDQTARVNAKALLANVGGKVIVIRLKVEGRDVGCGYGAVERGSIGIFDIVIAKEKRGQGYGRALLEGLLNAAQQEQLPRAHLSVVVGNKPAENLYQQLGFQELYRYWYRKSAQ